MHSVERIRRLAQALTAASTTDGGAGMVLLAEVVTAEEAAAGEIDEEKLSAMAAAFGQWNRASADSPSLIPLRNGKRPTQLVELA
eukprot:COSAG02_NODE_2283_length_9230_cov_25.269193_6_plen_85_part_00